MNFVKNFISYLKESNDVKTLSDEKFPENVNFECDDVEFKDLLTSQTSDSISLLLNITDDEDYVNEPTKSCNDLQDTSEIVTVAHRDDSLINLKELFQNLDGVEEMMYDNDGNEEITCSGSQCIDNVITTNAIIEETRFNLNEYETFCDGIERTEENLDTTEFISKNVDDIKTLYTTFEETLINLNEFDRIYEEFKSARERSDKSDDDKTYATLTKVTPIACFSSNTTDITKEQKNIDTENIYEVASVKAPDVHNVETNAVTSHNETKENQNTEVSYKHTISRIYPLMEDQNSIVYGVVLNNLNNNRFVNSEDNKDMDDVISISSTEETDAKPKTTQYKLKTSISSNEIEDSDHCSGYNSSDFEFITESDAENREITTKSIESRKRNLKSAAVSDRNYTVTIEEPASNNNLPGPSDVNDNIHSRPAVSNNFDHRRIREVYNRKDHRIPEGDDYLNLFQGIYAPALMSEMYRMENKCIQARNCRNIQYNGLGFDMRIYENEEESDDECREQAADTAKKIMSMYPNENRTPRQRRF